MSNTREPWSDEADEDRTARLVRMAGPRSTVPPTRAERVRSTVYAQWQVNCHRRAVRRWILSVVLVVATTAVLVLMLGRLALVDRPVVPSGEPVALVEQIDGIPRRVSDAPDAPQGAGLSRNDAVRTGEWIVTDARARVALRFFDGTSVRLDIGSRARPLSAGVIELATGAVYVDTGQESGRFEVRTELATARDVGTQFEVRVVDRTLRLRVRTGLVELSDGVRSVSGRGGTEVSLSAAGAVSRPIAVHGSEWDWTARVLPPLAIEGLALSTFLERIAREHGWALRYADSTLARDASGITLHGSVNGLAPHEAVEVAVATSGLRHRFERGELVVFRASDAR
jgi:hypothetical protein